MDNVQVYLLLNSVDVIILVDNVNHGHLRQCLLLHNLHLLQKLYISKTGRRLGDRFREHLGDVKRNENCASKPVARHFNLPNHSRYSHLGSLESRKTLEPEFIFQIGTLNACGVIERFFTEISTNTQTLLNS